MNEEWLAVEGYKGMYEVSSLGRVRSYHVHSRPRGTSDGDPHFLKPDTTNGYLYVALSNGKTIKRHAVHRLVAIHFVEPPPFKGATVNHKDFVKLHNVPENLEWLSRGANACHAIGKYQRPRGEAWHNSKLTEAKVREIRAAKASGLTFKELARIHNMSVMAIHKLVTRKTWAHIT